MMRYIRGKQTIDLSGRAHASLAEVIILLAEGRATLIRVEADYHVTTIETRIYGPANIALHDRDVTLGYGDTMTFELIVDLTSIEKSRIIDKRGRDHGLR